MNSVLEYLHSRGIKDEDYINFCRNGFIVSGDFVNCSLVNFDFMVDCFFDNSEERGFGLIPTNEHLCSSDKKYIYIGAIRGDDLICMDIETGKIKLWLIENGDGEMIEVAGTFAAFLEAVTGEKHV